MPSSAAAGVGDDPDQAMTSVATLTVMVGMALLLFAVVRLGWVVDAISDVVVAGLKVGVGLTIIAEQLPGLLGIAPVEGGFARTVGHAVSGLAAASSATVVVAGLTLGVLFAARRWWPRLPGPLLVLAGGIAAVALLDLDDRGVALIAPVPSGLPVPALPATDHVATFVPYALAITLMAYTETIAVGRSAREPLDPPISNNRELAANGLAAIAGGVFSTVPPAGGFSQTMVNANAGARTQLSGLIVAVITAIAALATNLLVGVFAGVFLTFYLVLRIEGGLYTMSVRAAQTTIIEPRSTHLHASSSSTLAAPPGRSGGRPVECAPTCATPSPRSSASTRTPTTRTRHDRPMIHPAGGHFAQRVSIQSHRSRGHVTLGESAGPRDRTTRTPQREPNEGLGRMAHEHAGARAFVTRTRIRVPRIPDGLVQRSRLVETGFGAYPVSLVCAPAGSGKTMLVADWARNAWGRGEPVAWLSIEDGDDRPYEFWSAVIDALVEASPDDAGRRLNGLSPPRHGMESQFITALGETLDATHPVRWLVLDDVQRIRTADVTAGLEMFLSELPPAFGAVLVCRSDPVVSLHQMRLSGRLHEVRAADLAFTESEAAAMFALLGSPLGETDVGRLVARTEGWAAGLRLAAVSLAAAPDTDAFISAFEGDQRAVADYLFAEIVQHLPSELYEFLLSTCVPEQLSVELAAELSGRPDAGKLLDQLCRANALVVQSGDSSWYRYHGLMRGFLTAVLTREDVDAPRRQHAAAARWFEHHDQPLAALNHALRARDDYHLTDLICAHGLRLILSGHAPTMRDTIARAAPAVRGDPTVATLAALAALDLADAPAADELLIVLDKHDAPDDPLLAAMRGAAVVQRTLLGGDVASALHDTDILAQTRTGDADVDLIVLVQRAPARMRGGDYAGAIGDLERALALARAGRYDQVVLSTMSQLSGISGAACDFTAQLSWARQAIEFAIPRGWADSPRLAYAYLLAAWTAFQTGDDVAQAHYADKAMRCLDGRGNVEVEMGVRSMYALATFEAETGTARHRAVADFRAIWQGPHADQVSPALIGYATPQEIRLSLAVGEHTWAVRAAERATRQLPDSAESLTMRAQLAYARGRVTEARRLLAAVLRGNVVVHVATTLVTANVLAAVVDAGQDNHALAFEAMRRALDWAAPRNFRRPFVDTWDEISPLLAGHHGRFGHADTFVADLLDQLPQPRGHPADTVLRRTLTPSELELLRDLPSPLSVKEIADVRGVSINTTKTHLSAVYRKLGVTGRYAAIREARARGLL